MKLKDILAAEYKNVYSKTILSLAKTENNETIEKIISLWTTVRKKDKQIPITYVREDATLYNRFLQAVTNENLAYTQEDITLFSIKTEEYIGTDMHSYIGQMLSALVNFHHQKTNTNTEYVLVTEHLQEKLLFLCKDNSANVLVQGNAGYGACGYMREGNVRITGNTLNPMGVNLISGTIEIFGDANDIGPSMKSGKIIVHKNASYVGNNMEGGMIVIHKNASCVGREMKNGTIIINGNIDDAIGKDMTGGEIYVNGENCIISDSIKGGDIYHKGTKVYSK